MKLLIRRCIESILSQGIKHNEKIHHNTRKFDRYFGGVINNTHLQETVKEGMVEWGFSSGDSGDRWVVGGSGGIEAGDESASMSVSKRTRGSSRC